MFDIFSNIFSGFKKKDIDVRGAAFRDEVQAQVGFPITLICRDDLPYPHKRAWELTERQWRKREKAVLARMDPAHRQYLEKHNHLTRDNYTQWLVIGGSCFRIPSEKDGHPPAFVQDKILNDLGRFGGQPFARYSRHAFERLSGGVAFYGVAPETPETYMHGWFPPALKPERMMVNDHGHLVLFHELAHTIFKFSFKALKDEKTFHAQEMLPDLCAIMWNREYGGKEEIVRNFMDMRALNAFAGTTSTYFTAPACEAFLKKEPIPSYQQVRTAYRELQMRSFAAGFNMTEAFNASCDELCAVLAYVPVCNFGKGLVLKNASSFMQDCGLGIDGLQGPKGLASLYRVMDKACLDPFTRNIGEGVLKAFDSFCPAKAARARKEAGVAKGFCERPVWGGTFYSLSGLKPYNF
ncbi:MAG: hypothetical protein FWF24_05680 [Alphaproteobacteria bacterium]|nr:hypothetical protein [Alphaproteobacteria bacterium]